MGVMGEDPKTWGAPSGPWHPNFDPKVETEMLRTFALQLIGRYPDYQVRLVVTEPGYMHVAVSKDKRKVATILITLNSDDGIDWRYEYNLRGEGGCIIEREFGPSGLDASIDAFHACAMATP
jgi:hypothetical protein